VLGLIPPLAQCEVPIAPSHVRVWGEPENIYSHGVFRILTQKRKFRCPPRGIFSLGKGLILLIGCLGQTLGVQ
jgi:hypothetical protein